MTVQGWYKDKYPATAALDGVSPGTISSSCAHPASNKPAEWWTDLGDVYKIYNITIYGKTDGKFLDWMVLLLLTLVYYLYSHVRQQHLY